MSQHQPLGYKNHEKWYISNKCNNLYLVKIEDDDFDSGVYSMYFSQFWAMNTVAIKSILGSK